MGDFLLMHILHTFDDLCEYLSRIVLAEVAMLLQSAEQFTALTQT